MSLRRRPRSEREQLELFRALPGDLAPRDAQDLMAYPFFSLAKTHRTAPIDFRMKDIAIRVEAVAEHGMATIWDADVLIWAASQIVGARDAGLRTSRLMAARPREILTFAGRGTSARDYHRLKAALDRLQSTTIATSLRQISERRMHRFSWINEWTERAGLVLPGSVGRRARVDDRPQILCTDGRRGAVALSRRSQARRTAIARMAFRVSASPCQICEPFSLQAFRFRIARHRAAPAPSRVQAADRARRPRTGVAGFCAC
jgi:hypothetical protein